MPDTTTTRAQILAWFADGLITETERADVSDLCAYRKLASSNSPALRRAIMRAEAMTGRKIDPRAVASGMHSHDAGATWSKH